MHKSDEKDTGNLSRDYLRAAHNVAEYISLLPISNERQWKLFELIGELQCEAYDQGRLDEYMDSWAEVKPGILPMQ